MTNHATMRRSCGHTADGCPEHCGEPEDAMTNQKPCPCGADDYNARSHSHQKDIPHALNCPKHPNAPKPPEARKAVNFVGCLPGCRMFDHAPECTAPAEWKPAPAPEPKGSEEPTPDEFAGFTREMLITQIHQLRDLITMEREAAKPEPGR